MYWNTPMFFFPVTVATAGAQNHLAIELVGDRLTNHCCCCCDSPEAHLLWSVNQVEEVCNFSRIVP